MKRDLRSVDDPDGERIELSRLIIRSLSRGNLEFSQISMNSSSFVNGNINLRAEVRVFTRGRCSSGNCNQMFTILDHGESRPRLINVTFIYKCSAHVYHKIIPVIFGVIHKGGVNNFYHDILSL